MTKTKFNSTSQFPDISYYDKVQLVVNRRRNDLCPTTKSPFRNLEIYMSDIGQGRGVRFQDCKHFKDSHGYVASKTFAKKPVK